MNLRLDWDPPAVVKGGTTVIAFVEDPDGYKIELIERHSTRDASRP